MGNDKPKQFRIMKQTELRKVRQEEYFRFSNSESAPLWIRGEYDRSDKKFECYKYDNVNHWTEFKGTRLVYVD